MKTNDFAAAVADVVTVSEPPSPPPVSSRQSAVDGCGALRRELIPRGFYVVPWENFDPVVDVPKAPLLRGYV
jgi:hypothetical protein